MPEHDRDANAASAFSLGAPAPHAPLRTFHPRRSPLGPARRDALERLWPRLGFSVHDTASIPLSPGGAPAGALDRRALFGRDAPLVVEIGSGMGEAVAAMAAADPDRDYLAVDAHLPGIANLLRLLDEAGSAGSAGGTGSGGNVRVAHGDALELLRRHVPESSLDAVHVFFPDPWPKAKHHKRRIIAPEHVALLRSRLRPGGVLHCATDWAPYAEVMLATLTADPELENLHEGFAPRPAHRPVTHFERRGLALGHTVADVVVRRSNPGAGG